MCPPHQRSHLLLLKVWRQSDRKPNTRKQGEVMRLSYSNSGTLNSGQSFLPYLWFALVSIQGFLDSFMLVFVVSVAGPIFDTGSKEPTRSPYVSAVFSHLETSCGTEKPHLSSLQAITAPADSESGVGTPGTRFRVDPERPGRHCGRVSDHGELAWEAFNRSRWGPRCCAKQPRETTTSNSEKSRRFDY